MKWVALSLGLLLVLGGLLAVFIAFRPRQPTVVASVRSVPIDVTCITSSAAVDAGGRLILCGRDNSQPNSLVSLAAIDPPPSLQVHWLDVGGTAPAGAAFPAVAVTKSNVLYVFGGWRRDGMTPEDSLDAVDLSDAANARWRSIPRSAPWPPGRNGATMVYDGAGERLILLLGDSGLDSKGMFYPLADLWQCDLRTQKWKQLAPVGRGPSARWHAMAAVVEPARRLYVIGGAGVSGFDHALYILDLATDSWRSIAAPGSGDWPPSMQGATLTYDPIMHALLLAGGLRHEPPGPATSADLWVFDLVAERWQRLDGGASCQRRDHCSFYDPASSLHILIGGQISQTIGNFYERGPLVGQSAVIRLTRSK
jgi:hypothetical protein